MLVNKSSDYHIVDAPTYRAFWVCRHLPKKIEQNFCFYLVVRLMSEAIYARSMKGNTIESPDFPDETNLIMKRAVLRYIHKRNTWVPLTTIVKLYLVLRS